MLLENKCAVVYGGGGSIGGAVARAFAREGARVYLAGRTLATLEGVAREIRAAGGAAETAQVDALDKEAVEQHLEAIIKKAGRIDISFNAVWIRGDLQGTPLLQPPEDFTTPVLTGVKTHFLTATAARHMVRQGSGVILTLSSSAAGLSGRDRRFHKTGGFSTACAATEALTRSLAGGLGPQGIRVVCVQPDALPETWPEEPTDVKMHMENGTALGRLPTLDEVANTVVFVASERAGAITGTTLNLTCDSIMD